MLHRNSVHSASTGGRSDLKGSFKDGSLDLSKHKNNLRASDIPKKRIDEILHELNAYANNSTDFMSREEFQTIIERKYAVNSNELLSCVFDNDQEMNTKKIISKLNFANAFASREESLRRAILDYESQLQTENYNYQSYEQIKRIMTPNQATPNTETPIPQETPRFLHILIKDAIYVLDPKFSNAIGTYLMIKTSDKMYKTKICFEYLKPCWNENVILQVGQENYFVDLEFHLIEKDDSGETDTIFGMTHLNIDQQRTAKGGSTWYPIHLIDNESLEIGKISLNIETVTSNIDELQQLVEEKKAIVQEISKILDSYRAELGQMERLFTSSTPPFNLSGASSQEFPVNDDYTVSTDDVRNIHQALLPDLNNFYEPNRYEVIRNYLLYTILFLSLISCFFRPDFLSMILFFLMYPYMKKEWSANVYVRSVIALILVIFLDLAWIIWRYCTPVSPAHSPEQFFINLSWFVTVDSCCCKIFTLICIFRARKLRLTRSLYLP